MDQFKTAEVTVTCLVDGTYVFEDEDFPEVLADQKSARLAAAGLTAPQTDFNAYVLQHAGGIDLVDTGCGSQFGPKAGHLLDQLAALGLGPDQIDRIILTHLHTDHAGGMMAETTRVFPRAQVYLHADELAYWTGRDAFRTSLLSAYAAQFETVTEGQSLGHGMTVWALPGHTPGHIGLRIGDGLVLTGDLIHSEALQLTDPETRNSNDTDRKMAEVSRRLGLNEICDRGLIWSGSHMAGPPKFAKLARNGNGYQRLAL